MAKHDAPEKTKAPRRKRRGLKICGLIFLCLCGLFSAFVGTVLWQFDYDYDPVLDTKTDEDLGITIDPVLEEKEITNIALFGVDSRNANGYTGNTDSIMIISIDREHNKIKLTSVMRDTLVYVPERGGYCKINSVFSKGVDLALRTLNTSYNMNIRDYAVINFTGMVDMIDSLGGLEITVTEAERHNANDSIASMHAEVGTDATPIRKAGTQVLNGAQAVAWARIRHVSTAEGVSDDFGRTDRQRHVMELLFNKALSAGASQYPALIKSMLPYVKTSLSYSDILSMAGILTGSITFEQTRIPQREYVIDADYRSATGSSTVYYNLGYAAKVLHAFVYDDIPVETYIEQNGVDKTPWVQ